MKMESEKIKENLKKLLRKFWQKLFLVLILLLVLDFVLGGIFFWQYYLRTKEEKVFLFVQSLKINQALMEKVSGVWVQRETIFESAAEKQYPDPFHGPITATEKVD
ncbi:hypothetical protein J7K42_02530 [bacterium]|nr:hypothetical protein [bacterium]